MKNELQTFATSVDYNRFTLHEIWFNNWVAIIKEVKSVVGEWVIESSISVPEDNFRLPKTKGGSATFVDSLRAVGLADKSFHAKQFADRFELPLHVCKILFKLNCEGIPYPRINWVTSPI